MPGGVTLQADRQGHYRGTALINNVAMPFLIDTGQHKQSFQRIWHPAAGLAFGTAIQTNTAGGPIYDRLTRINSLKIGNVEIRNIDAGINQHLQEGLIGMNALKYFRMTQDRNILTLVAYQEGTTKIMADSQAIIIPVPHIKESWKKVVLCDEVIHSPFSQVGGALLFHLLSKLSATAPALLYLLHPCIGESLFLRKLLWASLPNKLQKLRDG